LPSVNRPLGAEGPQADSLRSCGIRRAAELLLYFVGAAVALAGIIPPSSVVVIAVAAAVVTALHLAAYTHGAGAMRVLRWIARPILCALYAGWAYLAIVFGWLLGWSVPWSIRIVLLLLAALAIISARRPIGGVKVPILLPLGIWITLCLLGWKREDGVIRCDDYARFLSDRAATLMIPTTEALASCAPGKVLRLERYPRRIWEAPDSSRFLVTTQPGYNYLEHGEPVPDPLDGGVCEFGADGSHRGCVKAAYKTQAIWDAERLDRVFAVGWNGMDGGLFAFPRTGALRVVAEVRTPGNGGDGYYDPDADEIGLLDETAAPLTRYRASDFSPLPTLRAPFAPGEIHYNPSRHEGIFCFSSGPLARALGTPSAYLSAAFSGHPFSYRLLGAASPWAYAAAVWGCDFDPDKRVAWIAIASLPVIAVVDYDTGRVIDTWWAEAGLRSAVFDAARRRLYVCNFLRGDVIAFDVDSGRKLQEWFVGRFTRYVGISRDRNALFATSNLGVVRIPLAPELAPSSGSMS